MQSSLKFCGAAKTVTGSCTLVRHGDLRFLVDCGMFQGPKSLKSLNYNEFPFDPHQIDFVLLTHAHIDHSGLLPKLFRDGFDGNVYSTAGTADLLKFMLPDSGYIQEIEIHYLNRRNRQRGLAEVDPIYTSDDGVDAASRVSAIDYQSWFSPAPGVRFRLWNAGHILGSASIEIELDSSGDGDPVKLVFSGDIGPDFKLFHPDPQAPQNIDYVISESTYGNRSRTDVSTDDRRDELGNIINDAFARGGVIVIPAFSVERTQELLADIAILMQTNAIRESPVFLDSPMAIKATQTFSKFASELENIHHDGDLFKHPAFHFTESVDASKSINRYDNGVIIIAASGMCEAGRIRHHLKQRLWDPRHTILLTGFQAPGTLGAILQAGKKNIRIQGEDIRVKAKILSIDTYSGHTDAAGLVEWVEKRMPIRHGLFLNHGEIENIEAFKQSLVANGMDAQRIFIPGIDDEFDLTAKKPTLKPAKDKRIKTDCPSAPDWHNDLAQLSLDIREAMEGAADERARAKIVRRLRRALDD